MRKVIVTSFDENYYRYSMVAVKSIGVNYTGTDILDIVCLVPSTLHARHDEYVRLVNQPNINIVFRTSDRFTDLANAGDLHASGYISAHCNHRIFLGSVLPEYDIAIYIDPDTLTMRDIDPLINFPIRNGLTALQEFSELPKQVFNDEDRPYFNNGVFIADLNFWREFDAENKMVNWIANAGPTPCPEQDAMNAVFIDYWAPMPPTFNFFNYKIWTDGQFELVITNPIVVHFLGDSKPWTLNNRSKTKFEVSWAKFYHEHFNNYDAGSELLLSQISNMNSAQ